MANAFTQQLNAILMQVDIFSCQSLINNTKKKKIILPDSKHWPGNGNVKRTTCTTCGWRPGWRRNVIVCLKIITLKRPSRVTFRLENYFVALRAYTTKARRRTYCRKSDNTPIEIFSISPNTPQWYNGAQSNRTITVHTHTRARTFSVLF